MRPLGEVLCDIAQNKNISQAELDYLKGLINNIEMNASMTQGWVDGSTTQISRASVLAGSGNSLLDDQGLRIYNGATLTGWWEIDGTLRTGSNLAAANTTSFAVFPNLTTYNGESMPVGTVLMGSNSSGFSNIRYDPSTGQLEFRGGTTVQAYVDTDGTIVFGGGVGKLSSSGLTFVAPVSLSEPASVRWVNSSAEQIVGVYGAFEPVGGTRLLSVGYVYNGTQDLYDTNIDISMSGSANPGLLARVKLATGHTELIGGVSNVTDSAYISVESLVAGGSKITFANINGTTVFYSAGAIATISDSGLTMATGATINEFSIDTTMAGDSDTALPTEHATKTYVDTAIAGVGGGSGNLSLSWLV